MTNHRPFADVQQLLDRHAANSELLTPADWKEAFAAHPKIGEQRDTISSGQAQRWSQQEQSEAGRASLQVRNALQRRNQEYHERFGYIFIVRASGKSAEEMLAMLTERLRNDRARELEIAAAEQKKITELRLQKLVGASGCVAV
jgi:OHCU decarboxylase